MKNIILAAIIILASVGCKQEEVLPILGTPVELNGKEVPHYIPAFKFINQEGNQVTNADFEDKIYISNFFFTTCPTICPIVTRQMMRIHDKYQDQDIVRLISHTLDPKKDSIGALKVYADNIDVSAPKWNFVTGEKDALIAMTSEYFNIAVEDNDAPGGINHDGKIILVDKNKHVRSFCDGTDPDAVSRFLEDIDILIKEYEL